MKDSGRLEGGEGEQKAGVRRKEGRKKKKKRRIDREGQKVEEEVTKDEDVLQEKAE